MYLHIMIGTGSYTTSTTNMYNNTDYKKLPAHECRAPHATTPTKGTWFSSPVYCVWLVLLAMLAIGVPRKRLNFISQ